MADDKMPESKPTIQLAPPPPWAIEMMTAVKAGFAASSSRADDFDQHLSKQDTVLEQQNGVLGRVATESVESNTRLTRLEAGHVIILGRVSALEDRATTNSMKVSAVSQNDLSQESKLAETIVKTQALETAIHETRALTEAAAVQLKKQSDLMGIGKAGVKWLASSEGRQTLLQVGVTLFGFYEVLRHGGLVK